MCAFSRRCAGHLYLAPNLIISTAACSPLTPDAAFVGWKLTLISALLDPPTLDAADIPAAAPPSAVETVAGASLSLTDGPRISATLPADVPRHMRHLSHKASAAQLLRDARAAMIAELYECARQADTEKVAETVEQGVTQEGANTGADTEGVSPADVTAVEADPFPSEVDTRTSSRTDTATHSTLDDAAPIAAQSGSVSVRPPLPPMPLLQLQGSRDSGAPRTGSPPVDAGDFGGPRLAPAPTPQPILVPSARLALLTRPPSMGDAVTVSARSHRGRGLVSPTGDRGSSSSLTYRRLHVAVQPPTRTTSAASSAAQGTAEDSLAALPLPGFSERPANSESDAF